MIYLKDYLEPNNVLFLDASDKESILDAMINHMCKSPKILNKEVFRKAVYERESILSTGIGLGIAIPHVKIHEVKDIIICIAIVPKGVEWGAIDNKPVKLIFMIAGAEDQHELYLKILSKIVLVLKKKERRESLIAAKSADEVIKHFINL